MVIQEQDRVMELMKALDRARRAWRNAVPKTKLNKSQLFTMLILCNHGISEQARLRCDYGENIEPMTLSELAGALQQTMPAVSQRITRLEEQGYVTRTQDSCDRRNVWISVTEEGRRIVKETRQSMFHHMERVMALMEAEEPQSVDRLINGCNCLADALNAEFDI